MPPSAQQGQMERPVKRPVAPPRRRDPGHDRSDAAERMHAIAIGRSASSSAKQLVQVLVATVLVAGSPVAIVWWLRASGTVSSAVISVLVGVILSLGASYLGCLLWETRPDSEDLLFNELMIWGYVHRWHTQRQLASALDMVGPMSQAQSRALDGLSTKEQAKLLEQLVAGMETRDPYLHGHSRRVARHSWMIARRMRLSRAEMSRIRTAAAIHDVGKIRTPTAILHKKGALTDEEYRVIKLHPADGAVMADTLRDPGLAAMVRHHHERLDGTGYPDGLRGDAIPLGARIIAVADTFDAITSERPYRGASAHKKAMDILREEAGSRLDPDVVRAFCGHYAGRAPIALWAAVAGLPGRVLSWLGSGVGSVATAAKVAVVAALVSGAAVTSSTLGLGVSNHHPVKLRTRARTAANAPARHSTAPTTVSSASAIPSGRTRATARLIGNASPSGGSRRIGASAPAAGGVNQAVGVGVLSSKVAAGEAANATTEPPGKSGAPVPGSSRTEPPSKAKAEPPGKGKAEPPGKGKAEPPAKGRTEPPGKGAVEPPGKSKPEPPGQVKPEPPGQVKPEPPSPVKPEPPVKGKSEEIHVKKAASITG